MCYLVHIRSGRQDLHRALKHEAKFADNECGSGTVCKRNDTHAVVAQDTGNTPSYTNIHRLLASFNNNKTSLGDAICTELHCREYDKATL